MAFAGFLARTAIVKMDSMAFKRGDLPIRSVLLIFFFATLIVAAEVALYNIRWIVLTVAIGICIGVIVAPLIETCKAHLGLPRPLAAASVLGLAAVVIAFILFGLLRLGAEQIEVLREELPIFASRIAGKLQAAGLPSLQDQLAAFDLMQNTRELLQKLLSGIRLGGEAVSALVIVLVIAAYVSVSPSYYLNIATHFVPRTRRQRIRDIMRLIARDLRRWFFCQAFAMTMVGFSITLGLWLLDVDYWLLFGVATGVLDIIPFIGNAIPAVAAVVVSLADAPEKIPWIVALYIVVNQIENHLLLPLILKSRMNFPPVLLMSAMMILGSFFGVIGLLITPGLFSIAQTVLIEITAEQEI